VICYFARHGAAANAQEWLGSDADRPLTAKGRKQMARVAKRLAELAIEIDAIVTSPLLRAKETAEAIAEHLGVTRIAEDARLADSFDERKLEAVLRDHANAESILLVGHEPTMSATVGRIIGGGRVDFKKGAIACVEFADSASCSGTLLWLTPPKLLTD
jgi:phosphohistidine phosphatase